MSVDYNILEIDANVSEELDDNGFILNSFFLPEEVLSYMLSFLTPQCLVFQCRLVCRTWKRIVDEQTIWKHKVKRTKTQSLSKLSSMEKMKLKLPWFIYFSIFNKDPFEKNLLKNHCGQVGFEHWSWKMVNRWNIESVPIGADPLPDSEDFGGNTCCFATTYTLCKKQQIINLSEIGIGKHIIDESQPTIIISEWYAGRYDCGCKYSLIGLLLDEHEKILLEKREERYVKQWEGREWNKVTITFENYGPGVRYVVFEHSGIDTKFWAGHYGSKMSGAVVMVSLPVNTISVTQDQRPCLQEQIPQE